MTDKDINPQKEKKIVNRKKGRIRYYTFSTRLKYDERNEAIIYIMSIIMFSTIIGIFQYKLNFSILGLIIGVLI